MPSVYRTPKANNFCNAIPTVFLTYLFSTKQSWLIVLQFHVVKLPFLILSHIDKNIYHFSYCPFSKYINTLNSTVHVLYTDNIPRN